MLLPTELVSKILRSERKLWSLSMSLSKEVRKESTSEFLKNELLLPVDYDEALDICGDANIRFLVDRVVYGKKVDWCDNTHKVLHSISIIDGNIRMYTSEYSHTSSKHFHEMDLTYCLDNISLVMEKRLTGIECNKSLVIHQIISDTFNDYYQQLTNIRDKALYILLNATDVEHSISTGDEMVDFLCKSIIDNNLEVIKNVYLQ